MAHPIGPHADMSEKNSTIGTLAASAVFTGQPEDVLEYAHVTIFIDTDVDGSLSMEQSTDGTNWDRKKVIPITVSEATGAIHSLEVVSKYFRTVYTNGSTIQTHLRLQTLLHHTAKSFITSSSNEVINQESDVQLVRTTNDPALDITRGLNSDRFSFHRFGFNGTIPNGSYADVWSYGPSDATYNWPTTDETFRVKAGGNAADAAAGVGARTVTIIYLDANGDEQTSTVTTAGAGASTETATAGRRFIRAYVATSGTINFSNTGQILIENTSTGLIVGSIEIQTGITQMSMYTVPAGYTAYLKRVHMQVATGTNKDVDARMWQRTNAYTIAAPFGVKRLVHQWTALATDKESVFESPPAIAEKTDIWIEAQGNGAASAVAIDYDLILVKGDTPRSPQ